MPKPRIAVNGLGRIGRLVFQILFDKGNVDIVAINDIAPNDALVYLLKHDTAQGKWDRQITAKEDQLFVEGKEIISTSIAQSKDLPWKELDIDIVIECSGRFRDRVRLQEHIDAGARKVVISSPADKEVKTIVLGINDNLLSNEDTILSNASCTTNCLAPMVKVILDNFGLQHAIMNTIHAYTGDQKLHDSIHGSDFRRARAAAQNIVPTSSNANKALEWVIPEIKGKIKGGAVRVPVIVGSLTELYCSLEKPASGEEFIRAFNYAACGAMKNILAYTEDPIVSSDIIHSPYSCIFDAGLTQQVDNLVKIVGWYDNEYGYASRLAELVEKVAAF
ncbi:MAG: type I glyceraldehyde-3-phosphate dehydrogenase [Sphingobacteriales bacterium]|nr:type I glyceraldehyde-3-phosphate dehydrogenase [Sphingobacteriales bacterium]